MAYRILPDVIRNKVKWGDVKGERATKGNTFDTNAENTKEKKHTTHRIFLKTQMGDLWERFVQ